MEQVSDIQCLDLLRGRLFPIKQVKKVRGFAQIFPDRRQIESVSSPVKVSDDNADLRHNANRTAPVRFKALIQRQQQVIQTEHRDRRTQNIDRQGGLRGRLQEFRDLVRQ